MTFKSLEEQVLYYTLALTWVWYFAGAMYVVPPAVGWALLLVWAARVLTGEAELGVPPLVMVWWGGMLVMLLALVVGHLNWDLGIPLLIKSAIGWMKGWALFGVFSLIGGAMRVRASVLEKAASSLGIQTLCLIPLFLIAPLVGIPGTLYYSPLMALGGPGPEYFEVQLYGTGFEGDTRWRFFAPWAPAASVAFGILAPLVVREKSLSRRMLAIAGLLLAVMMSKSRLGVISIPLSLLAVAVLSRAAQPRVMLSAAAVFVAGALLGGPLSEFVLEQKENVAQMRADSTFVRNTLAHIALYRWEAEAPVWGHGVVEAGPPIVEEMPIGSHHSWYGLLFVKGAVGFVALLVPLAVTLISLIFRAQRSRTAQTALGVFLFFGFSTFTENVEMLAYLMWPGFVMLGIAARERLVHPYAAPLGCRHVVAEPA